jgi:hypothetical protein
VRFRRTQEDGREAAQVYGSNPGFSDPVSHAAVVARAHTHGRRRPLLSLVDSRGRAVASREGGG